MHGTALHRAAAQEDFSACDQLIYCGADVAAVDENGFIPLAWAIAANNFQTVCALLIWKSPIDTKCEDLLKNCRNDMIITVLKNEIANRKKCVLESPVSEKPRCTGPLMAAHSLPPLAPRFAYTPKQGP
ncbi:MAG: ankyrin repeat domain-containing protein [Gammaproteobacteria bacterium]|nr:ankyrin repeat domain-containing protein [Gammaproteobacteria bacterium]